MEAFGKDIKTIFYIRSEAEFERARLRGLWAGLTRLLSGKGTGLLAFAETVETLRPTQTLDRGLQDIPLADVVGSVGRHGEFNCHFLPRAKGERAKERWRSLYTLVVTGAGFPPIDVWQIGQVFFVKDGHHRVSVAKYLGWNTIQAYVTEFAPAPCPGQAIHHEERFN